MVRAVATLLILGQSTQRVDYQNQLPFAAEGAEIQANGWIVRTEFFHLFCQTASNDLWAGYHSDHSLQTEGDVKQVLVKCVL
jgi:hypothetical protein